jgi:hypothetical protein
MEKKMIKRRQMLKFTGLPIGVLLSKNSFAGVLDDVLGGGGGDWSQIAEDFNTSFMTIKNESFIILDVLAILAEALGLAEEAALIRGESKRLEETGDSFGGDELDAVAEISSSTSEVIIKKTMEAETLSAEQKAKMAEATIKYVPSLIKAIGAGLLMVKTVQAASSAGTPGVTDGMSVIRVARQIPTVGPAVIQYVSGSVEAGQSLTDIMSTKDVAVPDTSGLVMDGLA